MIGSARSLAIWVIGGSVALLFGALIAIGTIGASAQASCAGGEDQAVSAAGEPPLAQIYFAAAQRYRLGPDGYAYLASINDHESSFGTNMGHVPPDLAEGWMSFTPDSWSEYGIAVGHAGQPDPFNPYDAIYSAAHYLMVSGAPGDWSTAIFAYNHAGWYVSLIEGTERTFVGASGLNTLNDAIKASWGGRQPTGVSSGQAAAQPVDFQPTAGAGDAGGCCPNQPTGAGPSSPDAGSSAQCTTQTANVLPVPGRKAVVLPTGVARPPADAPRAVQTLIGAGDELIHYPYSWGGGHCLAAMQSTKGLGQCAGEEENGGAGWDCSGSTGFVLWQIAAGRAMIGGPEVSGAMMTEGDPGPGQWLTVFASQGHVFIGVAGIVLNTSWQWRQGVQPASPGTGPRWLGDEQSVWDYERNANPGNAEFAYVMRHPSGL